MKGVSFSRVVSGDAFVVDAFERSGAARVWWRAILWLHGKPTSPILSDNERRQIVAEGFRFYAQLYRFLGVLFWLVGGACTFAGIYETENATLYGTLASALAGGLLWFASGLGFRGAKLLRDGHHEGRFVLCAFMVIVIAFLSGLTAALSIGMQLQTETGALWNLAALGGMWAFGLGSYLIEVLYLVGEGLTTQSKSSTSFASEARRSGL